MGFFTNLSYKKKNAESAVLIDIGAESVAGAYAYYVGREAPAILCSRRIPVEVHDKEPEERAMLRALTALSEYLLREGAPILLRLSGNGHVGDILVSINSPWQETKMRLENFERKNPFVFTESIVSQALKETSFAPSGEIVADDSIINTVLNGYETRSPYGKSTRHASVTVLTSFIDKNVAGDITSLVRSIYSAENVLLIAGNSLRYQAIKKAFPHEHNALILSVSEQTISISLVQKNLLVALHEATNDGSNNDSNNWTTLIKGGLGKLTREHSLPRTIFLLANESMVFPIKKVFDEANFNSFWLSGNQPKIVPVLASHLIGLVRQTTSSPPDLPLLLMALYHHPHPITFAS